MANKNSAAITPVSSSESALGAAAAAFHKITVDGQEVEASFKVVDLQRSWFVPEEGAQVAAIPLKRSGDVRDLYKSELYQNDSPKYVWAMMAVQAVTLKRGEDVYGAKPGSVFYMFEPKVLSGPLNEAASKKKPVGLAVGPVEKVKGGRQVRRWGFASFDATYPQAVAKCLAETPINLPSITVAESAVELDIAASADSATGQG